MAESSMPAGAPAPADLTLRVSAGLLAVVLGVAAFLMRDALNPRIQAVLGIFAFISVVAAFSSNLRAVSWRTVGWGMALQLALALLILKLEIGGVRPGYAFFSRIGAIVRQFLEFTNACRAGMSIALTSPWMIASTST